MPLIKPDASGIESLDQSSLLPSVSFENEMEVLSKSGIIKEPGTISGYFARQMALVGLDPRSLMSKLALLAESAEQDSVKLSAVKTALQLYEHPALVPRQPNASKQEGGITFIIQSPNVNMQNVLSPRSDDQSKE